MQDNVKAKHLIAKLRDPARARIQALPDKDRSSYTTIVTHLKKLYLTEATKVRLMCELQITRQRAEESVQHFANRISKLIDRIYYDNTDPTFLDNAKTREFVYKVLPDYMPKLTSKPFATYSDAVARALQLEQYAAVAQDARERAKEYESRNAKNSRNVGSRSESNAQAASDASPSTQKQFAYEKQYQKFPSENQSSERKVNFKDGEIDSETYYRNRQSRSPVDDKPPNRESKSQFMKQRGSSPDGNYSGILRDGNKTPPGHIRKDPPYTPRGYRRIEEGPHRGKIEVDPNASPPAGFMKAQPKHFTFDQNTKPVSGASQSQMTPNTFVSSVAEKLGAQLNLRSRTPEKERNNSRYDNRRNQSRSPRRDDNRNNRDYNRNRSNSQDRKPIQRYYHGSGSNAIPINQPNQYWSNDPNQWVNTQHNSRSYERNPNYKNYQGYQRGDSPYNPFQPRNQSPGRFYPGYQMPPQQNYSHYRSDSRSGYYNQNQNNFWNPERQSRSNFVTLPEQRRAQSQNRSPSTDPRKANQVTVRDAQGRIIETVFENQGLLCLGKIRINKPPWENHKNQVPKLRPKFNHHRLTMKSPNYFGDYVIY